MDNRTFQAATRHSRPYNSVSIKDTDDLRLGKQPYVGIGLVTQHTRTTSNTQNRIKHWLERLQLTANEFTGRNLTVVTCRSRR